MLHEIVRASVATRPCDVVKWPFETARPASPTAEKDKKGAAGAPRSDSVASPPLQRREKAVSDRSSEPVFSTATAPQPPPPLPPPPPSGSGSGSGPSSGGGGLGGTEALDGLSLRRRWPLPDEKAVEVSRRMGLLAIAVMGADTDVGKLSEGQASRAFGMLCPEESASLGVLDAAFKALAESNEHYETLMFRHAVAGRALSGWGEASGSTMSQSLLDDDLQVFCFLRFLDADGDGAVSLPDFVSVLRNPKKWPTKRRSAS